MYGEREGGKEGEKPRGRRLAEFLGLWPHPAFSKPEINHLLIVYYSLYVLYFNYFAVYVFPLFYLNISSIKIKIFHYFVHC